MSEHVIRAAVISVDPGMRAVLEAGENGDRAVDVRFQIPVPFLQIRHEHLEELRRADPEVVFIDLEDDPDLGCRLAQFLAEQSPWRRIIATGGKASPEFLMSVMQAGASEYLTKPLDEAAVRSAVERVRRKLSGHAGAGSTARREPGRVHAFFAAKGGAGSTTVATNVAIQLHRLTGKKTVLVDLDLELGEIAMFMGVEPRFSFVDLARNLHRIDEKLMASFIEAHPTGVHVLSAPNQPEKGESVTADQIRHILTFLKEHYDHVVVDTSNSLTPRTLTTFDQADEIYLVANVDLPSLKNLQRCHHILQQTNGRGERVRLIVNRYQPECEITLEEVERALGLEIYWTLPNDYDAVIRSINTGQPVILSRCLYARELEALGAKITGLTGAGSDQRGGFGRRLLERFKVLVGAGTSERESLMLPPSLLTPSSSAR